MPPAMSSFARFAIQLVASESAGPPCGGLYLKPPSRGGLWLGVMTMPSATSPRGHAMPFSLPRLYVRIASDSAGVGTKSSNSSTSARTPFAASTSSAVLQRGRAQPVRVGADEQRAGDALLRAVLDDRLRDRGDVDLVERRRRGSSRGARDVPNTTRCSGIETSGLRRRYASTSASTSMRSEGCAGVPARVFMRGLWPRLRHEAQSCRSGRPTDSARSTARRARARWRRTAPRGRSRDPRARRAESTVPPRATAPRAFAAAGPRASMRDAFARVDAQLLAAVDRFGGRGQHLADPIRRERHDTRPPAHRGTRSRRQPARSGTSTSLPKCSSGSSRITQPPGPLRP